MRRFLPVASLVLLAACGGREDAETTADTAAAESLDSAAAGITPTLEDSAALTDAQPTGDTINSPPVRAAVPGTGTPIDLDSVRGGQ